MLGVRLKTWVKTHLGRERNHHNHNANSGTNPTPTPIFMHNNFVQMSSKVFPPSSSFSPYYSTADKHNQQALHAQLQAELNMTNNVDNKSINTPSTTGGLTINATLLSSPDTGYSTDGLSNSNINNKTPSSDSTSSFNTSSTTPLSQHYAISKKRDWFLQNTCSTNTNTSSNTKPSSVIPSISSPINFHKVTPKENTFKLHQLPPQQQNVVHQQHLILQQPSVIKPTRIKTNPWYNPKSKRLTCSSSPSNQPNKTSSSTNDNLLEHPRHSTITVDSGEGSLDLDSQKSSPRVSFSSSSLESYKVEQSSGSGGKSVEDWKINKIRFPALIEGGEVSNNKIKSSSHDCSREDDVVVTNGSSSRKSPYKINGSWYQPQPSVHHTTNTTTSSNNPNPTCSPYFIHMVAQNGGVQETSKSFLRKDEITSPNERGNKRRTFGFLKKLFRKGPSKKSRSNNTTNEVSIHDLYYHKSPIIPLSQAQPLKAPEFFYIQQPPSVPPRMSSFLTPTPNAFRRRTIVDTSTTINRKTLTPNIGYTYRDSTIIPSTRNETLNRPCRTDNMNFDNDTENYKQNVQSHTAVVSGHGPKLNSTYCSPTNRSQKIDDKGYHDYYSSPPVNNLISTPSRHMSTDFRSTNVTNSPVISNNHHQQHYNQSSSSSNETPSKRSHILNKKLILQSPTPFNNNSSYSPIHRVAVLNGTTNSGNNALNYNQIQNQNVAVAAAHSTNPFHNQHHAPKAQQHIPEFFSPQQQHFSRNPSSSFHGSQPRQNATSTFFSPQLYPATLQNDPRRRCFQYISSSNQNSPVLNTHRQSCRQQQQLQQHLLFNRLTPSPIIPSTFNHHRVHPIKNYIHQASATIHNGTKLQNDSILLKSTSSGIRSPAINSKHRTHSSINPSNINIEKIYEEIDDETEEENAQHLPLDNDEDEIDDDETLGNIAANNIEDESNKLLSSQHYSDEGDGQGGDYYQFDYDSSLLSTTEELDENSQEQPSTASTSTLLKTGEQPLQEISTQLQALPSSSLSYYRDRQIPVAASLPLGASVDISPTTRQLLEIENDLRFCRLIAEAQTLLKELETTTVSLSAARSELEQQSRLSNTNSMRRQQTITSINSNVGTYQRNHRPSSASRQEECPQSDPLRRKAYECWALRRLQQELAGCCASPLAFRHNLVPRQQLQKRKLSQGGLNL